MACSMLSTISPLPSLLSFRPNSNGVLAGLQFFILNWFKISHAYFFWETNIHHLIALLLNQENNDILPRPYISNSSIIDLLKSENMTLSFPVNI
uniref:Putative ovule protein n=1 Tax=Solanum chacoense TaxID=4108 RepID=A0A0V0H4Y0_SOLCH